MQHHQNSRSSQEPNPRRVLCPWCNSDEVQARTIEVRAGCTAKDLCRCQDCGRTFTVNHDD